MHNNNASELLDEVLAECGISLRSIHKGDYLFIVRSIVDCHLLDIESTINISQINKWKRISKKFLTHRKKLIDDRFRDLVKKELKMSFVLKNQRSPIPILNFEEREIFIKKLQSIDPNFFYTDDPKKLLGAIDRCIVLGDLVFEASYGEHGGIVFIDAGRYF
ncbi:MAG: hypothetical protein LBI18_15825 [Planctomycetaceae bacterium]|jgi:hypothetical protein|nr:hypothetical protein [Planctomycetaceae bacterium]